MLNPGGATPSVRISSRGTLTGCRSLGLSNQWAGLPSMADILIEKNLRLLGHVLIYVNVLNTWCSHTSYVNWIYYISWIFQNTCYTVYKGSLTKNSLRAPLVARKEVSSRKLMKGDCSTVLLFFKKKKKILGSGGSCIGIKKKFWAGVSRYPFPGWDEADSFNLRGGAVRAIYTRENKKRPPYMRRVLIVLNKTRTSPFKRHI